MTKVCSKEKGCGQEKDVSEFYKTNKTSNGHRNICKECTSLYKKQYRLNNPEKLKEREKQYRLNNPEKVKERDKQYRLGNIEKLKERKKQHYLDNIEKAMLRSSIRRAKLKGLEHNITVEDIQIPEYCPILGIKLEINSGMGFKNGQHNSVSLDRIDNSKGYIKGNVMVMSWRANSLKRDATIEELEKVLDHMKECRAKEEANNACSQQQA